MDPIIFFQSRPGADPDFLKRRDKNGDPNPKFSSFLKIFAKTGTCTQYKANIIISLNYNVSSSWYIWKIDPLALTTLTRWVQKTAQQNTIQNTNGLEDTLLIRCKNKFTQLINLSIIRPREYEVCVPSSLVIDIFNHVYFFFQ